MKLITATALAMTLAAGYSVAAAPKLHVTKTVTINAPADKVWNLVKDFNGLNNWHPAVAKDDIVEGTNNTVGAASMEISMAASTFCITSAGNKFTPPAKVSRTNPNSPACANPKPLRIAVPQSLANQRAKSATTTALKGSRMSRIIRGPSKISARIGWPVYFCWCRMIGRRRR